MIADVVSQAPKRRIYIGRGDRAILRTARLMVNQIRQATGNMQVRRMAEKLVRRFPARAYVHEVNAIYQFVKNRVRYTRDPHKLEFIQTPPYLLDMIRHEGMAFGDCDDMTTLSLSLMKSIGFNVKIKVTGYRKGRRNPYTHVYGLVNIPGHGWVPVDCIKKEFRLGFEAPGVTRFFELAV